MTAGYILRWWTTNHAREGVLDSLSSGTTFKGDRTKRCLCRKTNPGMRSVVVFCENLGKEN